MIFRREAVHQALSSLPGNKQAFFAFLCAERLVACCWAFSVKENWDISSYYEGCDFVFEHLSADLVTEASRSDEIISKLEGAIPHSEDYGYPLAIQAQSGMLALLHCLEYWRGGDSADAANAASAVVDALDNYEYFTCKRLIGKVESPVEYLLLDREIQWQAESISILGRETLKGQRAIELRLQNRSYAVPIAVAAEM